MKRREKKRTWLLMNRAEGEGKEADDLKMGKVNIRNQVSTTGQMPS